MGQRLGSGSAHPILLWPALIVVLVIGALGESCSIGACRSRHGFCSVGVADSD